MRLHKILIIIAIFLLTINFVNSVSIEGQTVIGRLIDPLSEGYPNESITIKSTTNQRLCALYGSCYCYSPECVDKLVTDSEGKFTTVTDNLRFTNDFYCFDNGGPEVDVTYFESCAPAGGPSYIDDEYDILLIYKNSSGLLWEDLYDTSNVRYVTNDTLFCELVNDTSRPVILGTIPNQFGSVNQTWNYDLSIHQDQSENRIWNIKAVNPSLVDVTINGNTITFSAKPEKYGYDKVLIELENNQTFVTDTQEFYIYINKTISFKEGWNLFSLPLVENNSVTHILGPLGNGNFGCGRASSNPYLCNPAQGDFEGPWTVLWAQKSPDQFTYFWPKDNYQNIATQAIQYIDPEFGYWLRMNEDRTLTLDYS
ncbi:hypothetical protein KY321_02620 [Candidatus Woesearchaeota archaeon]|nr:hypothetical protein [Candidatus Woesearchaeota archaeon]